MPQSSGTAIANYYSLSGLNNKHLLLTVLEAGKFKIKVLADLAPGRGPLSGL